jgi:hypothetical protein
MTFTQMSYLLQALPVTLTQPGLIDLAVIVRSTDLNSYGFYEQTITAGAQSGSFGANLGIDQATNALVIAGLGIVGDFRYLASYATAHSAGFIAEPLVATWTNFYDLASASTMVSTNPSLGMTIKVLLPTQLLATTQSALVGTANATSTSTVLDVSAAVNGGTGGASISSYASAMKNANDAVNVAATTASLSDFTSAQSAP